MRPHAKPVHQPPLLVYSHTPAQDTGTFRIIVWPIAGDEGHTRMLVLPPGKPMPFEQEGDAVVDAFSFKEEAVLMAGCDHIEPFSVPSGMRGSDLWVNAGEAKMLGVLMGRIVTAQREYHCTEKILGLLKVLFARIGRCHMACKSPVACRETQLFDAFSKLVPVDHFKRRTIPQYASALSVSPDVLNKALQTVSGMTASRLVQYYILCEAKKSAITSDSQMKKVAGVLRFDDVAHFSKFFRSGAGITFTEYKRAYAL